jgi:formate C-acetyltransferase
MSRSDEKFTTQGKDPRKSIAQPHDLLPRSKWLRDYYFSGLKRKWNNEFILYTTGEEWDVIFFEGEFYIAPEILPSIGSKGKGTYYSAESMAIPVDLPEGFWDLSLPERRTLFFEKVILDYLPQEIISENDLLAGGRFNTILSRCLNEKEADKYWDKALSNRDLAKEFHNNGFGNCGTASGHIICDHETVIKKGFKHIYNNIKKNYNALSEKEKEGSKGNQLRAMMRSAEIPRKLAKKYAEKCRLLKEKASSSERAEELEQMARNLEKVPWEPAQTFWQGLQAMWLTHMMIMSEESYPGAGTSFGRFDQILWPLYKHDIIEEKLISKDFAKEILGSFWFHCHTAYDALMKMGGKHGINSSFGQLITLSGCGPNGEDMTNELTYTILEVIDEWYPSLEPKPNVRLHRNSPDRLLDILIDMISRAQGAPFLLNFDERSIAGMVLEGIPEEEAWDYACVGCLENTMQGNDRSGTVNCNPNLAKSIELTLWNGKNMPSEDPLKSKKQLGPKTGNPEDFETWEEFWNAWQNQTRFLIKFLVDTYNPQEELRSTFLPTPYVSTIVKGCAEKGLDVRQGGPELRFITVEGVGYATTVDSLLSIKKFVYDEKKYTISDVKEAILKDYEVKNGNVMQARFKNKGPKYGNDRRKADELARKVMKTWTDECWKYKTPTDFQYRPGMLSWNYWAGVDAQKTIATPDGRNNGNFLSNAICPNTWATKQGPTAITNSVGKALGGKTREGKYINYLPNGASHTISFNPSVVLRDKEHKEKFRAFLRGYIENGGTALQINMVDSEMLKDAQKNPEEYEDLLVRVTGYNAYFVTIGRELQDQIISREEHKL